MPEESLNDASPFFDLDEIERCGKNLELVCHHENDQILVEVMPSVRLCFVNLYEQQDNLIGFKDTSWHTHGFVEVMTSRSTSLTYGAVSVLKALKSGELLIAARYLGDALDDRWIVHKSYIDDGEWLEAGFELRYSRIS